MSSNDPTEAQPVSRPVIVEKELSHIIVGCFFDVYNELGYGFVESLYARALDIALRTSGLQVDREYPMIVTFRGQQIGFQRVDMLVERRIVLDPGILLHFGPLPRFYRVLGVHPRHTNQSNDTNHSN